MSDEELIGHGAEASVFLLKDDKGKKVRKDRLKKSYRISEIDNRLRRSRTKREAKVLKRLEEKGFPAPKIIFTDDKEMKLTMEHIDGPKVRDVLEEDDYKGLSKEIGRLVAELHNETIIHGDLTTSNMIIIKKSGDFNGRVFMIDFGLSFFSKKVEDMAVDIHLFRQAMESKHFRIWESCLESFMVGYSEALTILPAKDVIKRYEDVELRGRHKAKF